MQQQPQQQWYYPQPQYQQQPPSNPGKAYAVAALCFFLAGGLLHVFGLIPFLGIFFVVLGLICDAIGIIFLIICIAS